MLVAPEKHGKTDQTETKKAYSSSLLSHAVARGLKMLMKNVKMRPMLSKTFVTILDSLIVVFLLATGSWGANYYVDQNHPNASDKNSGQESHPFKTVQKGIESAISGETVYIRAGEYNLSGFSKCLENGLSLVGEAKDTTVLINGGKLECSRFLKIENLTFENFPALFYPRLKLGQEIESISIQNCTFRNVPVVLSTTSASEGKISNVDVANCEFKDISAPKVGVLLLRYGSLSKVRIMNNTFRKLESHDSYCMAIVVGSKEAMETTTDVVIRGNYIDSVTGPVRENLEVKGILAFGENILIEDNVVKNLTAGQDHEAIYMKADYSQIKNNIVENCGSGFGGADICIKGGKHVGNIISNNIIRGSIGEEGGMLINGQASITNNFVEKPSGSPGIAVYTYGEAAMIKNNHIKAKGVGIYLSDAAGGEVTGNYVIAYQDLPMKIKNSLGVSISGNTECQGNACGDLPLLDIQKLSPPQSLKLRVGT